MRLESKVSIQAPPGAHYTLASSDAPLEVTVRNDLSVPVRVTIRITALDGERGFRAKQVPVQTIAAGAQQQIKVKTHVDRSGHFRIRISLLTPHNVALRRSRTITVNSTALGAVALWITGIALGVLVLALAVRVVRRIAQRGRPKPGAPVIRAARTRSARPGTVDPSPGRSAADVGTRAESVSSPTYPQPLQPVVPLDADAGWGPLALYTHAGEALANSTPASDAAVLGRPGEVGGPRHSGDPRPPSADDEEHWSSTTYSGPRRHRPGRDSNEAADSAGRSAQPFDPSGTRRTWPCRTHPRQLRPGLTQRGRIRPRPSPLRSSRLRTGWFRPSRFRPSRFRPSRFRPAGSGRRSSGQTVRRPTRRLRQAGSVRAGSVRAGSVRADPSGWIRLSWFRLSRVRPSRRLPTRVHRTMPVPAPPTAAIATAATASAEPTPIGNEPSTNTAAAGTADRGLLSSSRTMAVASLASRITGFLRTQALVAALGIAASKVADAYNVANTLPNMVYTLLIGGVLSSVVIPLIVHAQEHDSDRGEAYTQRLLSWGTAVLAVVTTVAVLAAPWISGIFPAPRAERDLISIFATLLLPEIFFYGLGALYTAVLNTRGVYGPPAWASVLEQRRHHRHRRRLRPATRAVRAHRVVDHHRADPGAGHRDDAGHRRPGADPRSRTSNAAGSAGGGGSGPARSRRCR